MNVKQLNSLIKTGYRIKRPVCVLSSPGLGKSSVVRQASEELAKDYGTPFGVIEIRAASSSPAELETIKYVDHGMVLDAEQAWLPTNERVAKGECPARGFIFCDELSAGIGSVVSILQRLFLDRKLGGLSVADNWYIIAAGNRTKDKSNSGNLSRAFQNRCIMATLEPDWELFIEWGVKNNIDPRILAYTRFQPECLMDGMETHRKENQAFCSPRSLHIASDVLQDEEMFEDKILLFETLTGVLGDAIGSTVVSFMKDIDDLPDIDRLLKSPRSYPVPDRANITWATIGAINARLKRSDDPKLLEGALDYYVRFDTELGVIAIKELATINDTITDLPAFNAWATDHLKFINN